MEAMDTPSCHGGVSGDQIVKSLMFPSAAKRGGAHGQTLGFPGCLASVCSHHPKCRVLERGKNRKKLAQPCLDVNQRIP
jgi:hypothetical protein